MTFDTVLLKEQVDESDLLNLAGPLWLQALTALYLRAGKPLPEIAKRYGAAFGFCDEDGNRLPRAQATHFGMRAGPP